MRISELEAWLAAQREIHGDIDVSCMTAPFNDGETEVLSADLIGVSEDRPDNGRVTSNKVITIGYVLR